VLTISGVVPSRSAAFTFAPSATSDCTVAPCLQHLHDAVEAAKCSIVLRVPGSASLTSLLLAKRYLSTSQSDSFFPRPGTRCHAVAGEGKDILCASEVMLVVLENEHTAQLVRNLR
jgi:hypothetical protein